jgi:hypothetical protein
MRIFCLPVHAVEERGINRPLLFLTHWHTTVLQTMRKTAQTCQQVINPNLKPEISHNSHPTRACTRHTTPHVHVPGTLPHTGQSQPQSPKTGNPWDIASPLHVKLSTHDIPEKYPFYLFVFNYSRANRHKSQLQACSSYNSMHYVQLFPAVNGNSLRKRTPFSLYFAFAHAYPF